MLKMAASAANIPTIRPIRSPLSIPLSEKKAREQLLIKFHILKVCCNIECMILMYSVSHFANSFLICHL